MGGSGSGGWYRFDSKTLTEHCISIDVRYLSRKGWLEPWQRYSWRWQDGNCITIETKPEAIELDYTISYDGESQKINYEIPLTWTSCNYGEKRPWFICPGKGCGRRVAIVYSRHGYFLCRHCHDLAYLSQRKAKIPGCCIKLKRSIEDLAFMIVTTSILSLNPKECTRRLMTNSPRRRTNSISNHFGRMQYDLNYTNRTRSKLKNNCNYN
jgi:hypothetical protein